jgi:hypothetical protein
VEDKNIDIEWWTSFTGSACSLNSFPQHFLVLHPFGRAGGEERRKGRKEGHERVILIQIISDEATTATAVVAAVAVLFVIQFRVLTFDFETMS